MSKRLLFIGGRRRGAVVLERLITAQVNLAGCIVMKDDPHEQQWSSVLEDMATKAGVPFVTAKSVSASAFQQLIDDWKPSVAIAENWRAMVPSQVYQQFEAFIVLHEAMLPKYRGFAPLAWQLINGETVAGVTMFHIAEDVDAGDVIDQRAIAIEPHDTANDLYAKTIPVYAEMIEAAIGAIQAGSLPRRGQDHSQATFACARTPEDGRIHWNESTKHIYDLIRGVSPPLYPGAWTTLGDRRVVICSARPVESPMAYVGRIPGRVVQIRDRSAYVLTGDGVLEVQTIHSDTGECLPASSLIRSVRAQLGARHEN